MIDGNGECPTAGPALSPGPAAPVPPAGFAVAVPVVFPKQRTSTFVVVTESAAAGWVIVTLAVSVQRFASVMATV